MVICKELTRGSTSAVVGFCRNNNLWDRVMLSEVNSLNLNNKVISVFLWQYV